MFSTYLLCQIILTLICQTLCYEPTEKDLKCFNDYETEMKCSFWFDGLINCSGYKLNIRNSGIDTLQTCTFEKSHHSADCECKIKVDGFVSTEEFTTTLVNGTNVLLSKTFVTMNFIKPKTPVVSVQKTKNGDFKITWDVKYEKSFFSDHLEIHLTYRTEGENETMSMNVQNSVGFYEIVDRNLQPNTNYILTARMSTDYNNHKILSDQSAPVEFTSSSSPNELLKTMVPILCCVLIVIICTTFICVLRVKMNWWDKISKPKIDANIGEEKGHILPPSIMDFSSIHVEIPTLDFEDKKKLISTLSVDTNNEKSSHSFESGADDYGQAGFDSGSDKENCNVLSRVERAREKDFISFLSANKTPSNQQVEGFDFSYSGDHNRAKRDSGNCSGSSVFSNMTYLTSANDNSSFLVHSCQSDISSFENSSTSVDMNKSQFNVPTNDVLEDGYQPFNSGVNQGNDADVSLNLSNDVDSEEKLLKNLIISKNPVYPSLFVDGGSVAPSDGGYQALEDLTKSTKGQLSTSIRTEQALKECGALKSSNSTGLDPTSSEKQSLWPSLLFSTKIEIDTSYQSY
ncbi:uncharacterized protein LOC120489955 [Pimephales promelas]|uniref:uncharacterized protein LOC120489955 n=1 Tax=Pimephales promelas TaxID=90988 RepID=UPI001955F3A2|nr:uncharacterized protein LOC120489955 [Pimephales promelas]